VETEIMSDAADDPALMGTSCGACGRPSFPTGTTCPWCGSADTTEVALARTGTLWGWTAVTAAPPGYEGDVPFGFGVVELDDELRVITRLTEADPSALTFGQRVHLVTDVVAQDADGGDVVGWAFAPGDG
jgi:uncharacterized OB-fold protein